MIHQVTHAGFRIHEDEGKCRQVFERDGPSVFHRVACRKYDADVIGQERGELDVRIGHSQGSDSKIDLLILDQPNDEIGQNVP